MTHYANKIWFIMDFNSFLRIKNWISGISLETWKIAGFMLGSLSCFIITLTSYSQYLTNYFLVTFVFSVSFMICKIFNDGIKYFYKKWKYPLSKLIFHLNTEPSSGWRCYCHFSENPKGDKTTQM